MSLLAWLYVDRPFLGFDPATWRTRLTRWSTAWTTPWARLPTPHRLLEVVAITIVIAAAALFVWVLWTQPAHRR
jgi:hypothetical protein